jgi:outer membrane lipoprotein-sorting protein
LTVCLFLSSAMALLSSSGLLAAAEAPAWWRTFIAAPRMEARFEQEAESAVFGKQKRSGLLRMAKGGRIRVEYQKGLLLVADGRTLVQYDPDARSAQQVDLRSASKDAPLLLVLLDPGTLGEVFTVQPGPGPDTLSLEPRKPGLPRVTLEGRGGLPRRITWTDPTGARQVLSFTAPTIPARPFEAGLFTFKAPAGTRWLSR